VDDETRGTVKDDTTGLLKEEGVGAGTWIKLVGIIILVGLAVVLTFVFISRALFRWGFVGGFLVVGVILLIGAWLFDRREARLRRGDY